MRPFVSCTEDLTLILALMGSPVPPQKYPTAMASAAMSTCGGSSDGAVRGRVWVWVRDRDRDMVRVRVRVRVGVKTIFGASIWGSN